MKIKKLNSRGFSHSIVLVLFVVIFAIAGIGYIVASHAATSPGPIIYATPDHTASGAWQTQTLMSLDPATGKKTVLVTPWASSSHELYGNITYSPNSHYVAWTKYMPQAGQQIIQIYSFSTGTVKTISGATISSLYDRTTTNQAYLSWDNNSTKIAFLNHETGKDSFYTVNVDGSGLTPVYSLPIPYDNYTKSMVMAGDGSKLIYMTNQGLYTIQAGGSPVQIFDRNHSDGISSSYGTCGSIRLKPGTTQTIAYDCDYHVYTLTIGSTPQNVYNKHVYVDYLRWDKISGLEWSPDGSKLALKVTEEKHTEDQNGQMTSCVWTNAIVTVNDITNPDSNKVVSRGDSFTGDQCTFSGPEERIVWDNVGKNITFMGDLKQRSPDNSLWTVSAVPGSTPKNLLTASSLSNFGWNGGADLPIRITTTPPPTVKLAGSCNLTNVPATLKLNKTASPKLTIKNLGNGTFTPRFSEKYGINGKLTGNMSTKALKPGQSFTFDIPNYMYLSKSNKGKNVIYTITSTSPKFSCTKTIKLI